MSKKCGDHNKFCCDRGSCPSPKLQGSSSKRKRSRSHKKSSRGRESSSRSSKKSKRTRKARIEHSVEFESTENESGTSRSKIKRSRKTQRKGIEGEKRRKKRKRKKKIDSSKKRRLSGSSTCSRLIELLIKSCCCLKGFDSSSSSSPPYAETSCCCRCKCRFCTPDCDSKSIQCDDCDNLVAASRRSIHDDADNLRDSEKKGGADLTNRGVGKSLECITHEKSSMACTNRKNDFRLDFPGGEAEEALKTCTCKRKNKSDSGIRSTIAKSLTALKDFGKRRISARSLVDQRPNLDIGESPKDRFTRHEASKLVSPERAIFEANEDNPKSYTLACSCRGDGRSKSSKALLIMFDIVFWPYTCFPKRQSLENKNKKT